MEKSIVLLSTDFSEKLAFEIAACGADKLYLHANPFTTTVEQFLDFKRKNEQTIEKLEEGGLIIEYQLHALSKLLPRTLFQRSPELFRSTENGERIVDMNCCASCAEALEIIGDGAFELARTLRQKSFSYHLWQDDDLGADCRCHCEKCKQTGSLSQYAKICDTITDGLKRYDGRAKNALLIYGEENEFPSARADRAVEFAPFRREHYRPITEGERNAFFAEKLKKAIASYGTNNVLVLEYFLSYNFADFLFDGERVRKDLEFYRQQGISAITSFAVFNGANDEDKISGIKKYFKMIG